MADEERKTEKGRTDRIAAIRGSHQLRVVRGAKLVKGTKEGKEVKYSLDDDHVTKIMEYGLTHVDEDR